MTAQPRQIKIYLTTNGKSPFREWFDTLRDRQARKRIRLRFDRCELGNLGDFKSVGQGVFELRIDYGSGYRIYFGQDGVNFIIILCGGDKSGQQQDIAQAKIYWREYEEYSNTEDYRLS